MESTDNVIIKNTTKTSYSVMNEYNYKTHMEIIYFIKSSNAIISYDFNPLYKIFISKVDIRR